MRNPNPHGLSVAARAAFTALADAQRGAPEAVMLRVQNCNGGGVLNYIVEHCGDLVNRAAEHWWLESFGYDMFEPKVSRSKRILFSGYGFEREHDENVRANSRCRNADEAAHRRRLDKLLADYADAHEALPAYNQLHAECRRLCVAIGRQSWSRARASVAKLSLFCETKEKYTAAAADYTELKGGRLLEL